MTVETTQCLVMLNRKFAHANVDQYGNIVGPIEPLDVAEVLGCSLMQVSNRGQGLAWLKGHRQKRTVIQPEAAIVSKSTSITIGMVDGESTAIEVLFFAKANPSKSDSVTADRRELSDDCAQQTGKVEMTACVSGPLKQIDIAERFGGSVMYVSNQGPGATRVNCRGKKGKVLEPNTGMFVKPTPITIGMIDGESTAVEVVFFAKGNKGENDALVAAAEESGVAGGNE
jgi:hypothetical protein